MSEEHPVIPTRQSAGSLGEGPVGQMDMLSLIANAADWLEEAVAENATTATLTDAEQSLIRRLAAACEGGHPREWTNRALTADDRATLRGLLERLSPPAT